MAAWFPLSPIWPLALPLKVCRETGSSHTSSLVAHGDIRPLRGHALPRVERVEESDDVDLGLVQHDRQNECTLVIDNWT